MAEVLGVDVVEYMGYENGRKMINYSQIKRLSSLYHVNIIEIFRNNEDVTLYDVANQDTDKLNIEYFIPKKTLLTRIKEHPLLSGLVFGLIVACVFGTLFMINSKNRPYVSYSDNTDRLSVSDTSVIYIDNLGAVKGSGDNANGQISNLPSEHATKVCEGSNFSVILLDDGTVKSIGLIENYQKEIKKWKNISDIAVGDKHIIAVDNIGRTHCIGDNSNNQCEVSEFSNIKNVYATANGSIGIDYDGKIYYTGQFVGTSKLKSYTNILDVDTSNKNLIVLKEDGTCDYVASNDDALYFKITKWKNIIDVACGDDYFAGLKEDGTVVIASLSLKESIVSNWKNIIAIDGGNDYLIGFDGKDIHGVGKNNYHQFESEETILQSLPQVKNILVDYNKTNVKVSFDAVSNASEYEISLLINDETKVSKKVKTNEIVSFDTNLLEDNNIYEISVVAKGDQVVYGDSLVSKQEFIFLKEIEEISEEKVKIRFNLSGTYRGDVEEYLRGLGVEEIGSSVDENIPCDGTIETVLDINGITPGNTYTKTELNARNISYTYCKLNVEMEENDNTNLEG